jgi:hypothetical protein
MSAKRSGPRDFRTENMRIAPENWEIIIVVVIIVIVTQ